MKEKKKRVFESNIEEGSDVDERNRHSSKYSKSVF
jgi:hypothetical protein